MGKWKRELKMYFNPKYLEGKLDWGYNDMEVEKTALKNPIKVVLRATLGDRFYKNYKLVCNSEWLASFMTTGVISDNNADVAIRICK